MTEDEALRNIVKAWDSLKEGYYDKDLVETWLIDKMKPAVEKCRKTLENNKL